MTSSQWDYRTTEVLTAPPQKLQLLLLEAALRHIQRTEAAWQAGQIEAGYETLEKARAIVGELLAAIRPELWPEVAPRVAAVYRFVYLSLGEAGLTGQVERLRDAARVLEIERQTWQELCRRLQEGPSGSLPSPGTAESSAGFSAPGARTGENSREVSPLPEGPSYLSTPAGPHLGNRAAQKRTGPVAPGSDESWSGFLAEA